MVGWCVLVRETGTVGWCVLVRETEAVGWCVLVRETGAVGWCVLVRETGAVGWCVLVREVGHAGDTFGAPSRRLGERLLTPAVRVFVSVFSNNRGASGETKRRTMPSAPSTSRRCAITTLAERLQTA